MKKVNGSIVVHHVTRKNVFAWNFLFHFFTISIITGESAVGVQQKKNNFCDPLQLHDCCGEKMRFDQINGAIKKVIFSEVI